MKQRVNIEKVERGGKIIWIYATFWDQKVFVDVDVTLTQGQISEHIQSITDDQSVYIADSGHLKIASGVVFQVWKILGTNILATPTCISLEGTFTPDHRLSARLDDGTIWKSKWRYDLLWYTKHIFWKAIPEWTKVVFMPGYGNDEVKIWRWFYAKTRDMVMIEWDPKKLPQLKVKHTNNGQTPSFVGSYMWTGDESFSRELISVLWGEKTSVLSFDTESSLTHGLCLDIAWVLKNIELSPHMFFVLNVVWRGSWKFCETFCKEKWWVVPTEPIEATLKQLPEFLIQISGRKDIAVVSLKVGKYLWGSSTPMYYVFCHLQTVWV